MPPKRPTFLIIGAAKCGTTSLATILSNHPDCCIGRPKEVCYFQDTIDFESNPNYAKGWDWYQKAFSHFNGEHHIGEATPSYSDRSRSPETAKRVFKFNPDFKLIYLVRDPLERQKSAWQMQHLFGSQGHQKFQIETMWALRGFEFWMREQKKVAQWDVTRYSYQLEAYREFFPENQILVSFLEDWRVNQTRELARICEFIGLDSDRLVIRNPDGENRAVDKTIESKWFRYLKSSPLLKSITNYSPSKLNYLIGKSFGRIPAPKGNDKLTKNTKREYLDYIRSDATKFLAENLKPSSFWTSLSRQNNGEF